MKNNSSTFTKVVTGILLLLFSSCQKELPKEIPTVNALLVTNITSVSAQAGGEVTSDGGTQVTERGMCWSSTNQTPTVLDNNTTDGSGLGVFTSNITGLTGNTTYYIRAYAINSVGISYYSQAPFKTLALPLVITTSECSLVTATTFKGGGIVPNDGGSPVDARGVCWSTTINPTIHNSKTSDGTGAGSFTSSITGLNAGTTYYVRAYAANNSGTAYGNQVSFTTPGWLATQASWLNAAAANTISSPANLLDNDPNTKGGLAMSYYSTLYTKDMYLNFGAPKTLSGFKFTFEFPNVLAGKCSTYPGPGDIAHTCLGNLYYKNANGQWVAAYLSPELNVSKADQGCPMKDIFSVNFPGISAKEWKFEMVGLYWLGGSYQTTTYYQVYDIQFFGY